MMHTNVISYSLRGNQKCYYHGAVENIALRDLIYPEWEIYIYYEQVDEKIVRHLSSFERVHMVPVEGNEWDEVHFWRYLAFEKDDFDVVITRDIDDRLSIRDRTAVYEWLASSKPIHVIRDHPWHNMPMMAGLIGARNGALKGIYRLIREYHVNLNRPFQYGDDELFLKSMIHSRMIDKFFIHATTFFEGEKEIHSIKKQSKKYLGIQYERHCEGDRK